MQTTIEIDIGVMQLFAGTRLPSEAVCSQCEHPFDASDRCIISATRLEDAPTYTIEQLYCANCAPETIPAPTLGMSEYLVQSRLTRTLDSHTQHGFQILHDPQAIDTSAPSEGAPDRNEDTSTALDVVEEIDPEGDPEITDAQHAMSPTPCTNARANNRTSQE